MLGTMWLLVAYVLFFLLIGQLCLAAPAIAVPAAFDAVNHAKSVIVDRPVTVQNVPVAQVHVPYAFQLDPKTFIVVGSDSGVYSKAQPIITWERSPDNPAWLSFESEKLIFSGTPDSIPDRPIRLRLLATASESQAQNDTSFDLYVSDSPIPSVISTLESQQNKELIRLNNASYLTLSTGVWIHPGAGFSVQLQPFCNEPAEKPSLYYNAYHPSKFTVDPLPQWLKFDNVSLTFSGVAPIEPTATNVVIRCSNVFGAGGPEQRMVFEITRHMLELEGPVLPFQFTPGRMFTYNFHWLWHQLYLDGEFFAQAFSRMRFSGNSRDVLGSDLENGDDIGISFGLDEYPWLSFDRTNQTIYGMPPILPVLPKFPPIPLNITCRGREINTQIYATSLAASAWTPSPRPASITIRPGISFTYNFTLELIESVASNHDWDVFVRFNDPFSQTSWLQFDPSTRVLSGTVPVDSPPREITALATSNAWGFNTTTSYLIIVDNPDYTPPSRKVVWNQTTVALLVSLIIMGLFLAMGICICCGLREGCLVSYPVLMTYYCGPRSSDQTLVDDAFGPVVDYGSLEAGSKDGDSQPHTEKTVEGTHTISLDAPERYNSHDPSEAEPASRAEIVPIDAFSPSTISSAAQTRLDPSIIEPQAKLGREHGLRKHLIFSKKRVLFGKGNRKDASNRKLPTVLPAAKPKSTPFIPMWHGHTYQTPELLAAEERNWRVRRQERKARLKRQYLIHKQTGIKDDTNAPEEKHDVSNPDAPRRFGIFEQLAAMEDLDRKGPANMRGQSFTRSRLVEVGENRFFDDTMLDRSEVGSSEFSSLASWETLSESSLPNMVLCYGQLGRRKMKEDVLPHGAQPATDFSGATSRHAQEFFGSAKDSSTNESDTDRIARALSSLDVLDHDASIYDIHKNKIWKPFQETNKASNTDTVVNRSPIQWRGKGVARGEHGSPTTSQHSPTFKNLARQRFRASIDGKLGSPLSRPTVARTLAYNSHSSGSIGSIVSRSSTNFPVAVSLVDVFFHLGSNGMQFYFVPAKTKFCFKVQVAGVVSGTKNKLKPRLAGDEVLEAETDGHFNIDMPDWLHFNASTLEFWGQTPDTRELLQYSMRVVKRPANKTVCQLLMAVARPPLLAAAKASLANPVEALDTPSGELLGSLCSLSGLRMLESPLESSRSVTRSNLGSNVSVGSMATSSVVFHFKRQDVEVFVVPAATKFCFKVPVLTPNEELNSSELAPGRTAAPSYSIQLEECDVTSIPHWLHCTPSTMEFWGEAPNVEQRLHVVMRIIQQQFGKVVGRVAIIITHMDDAAQLEACFGYSRSVNEGLSIVEEVSSIVSDDAQADHTIPNGTLDVVSRAASREGSIHLSVGENPILINPTLMNDVEYYVVPQGVDFRFLIGLPILKIIPKSGCHPSYDVLVEPQAKDGWKFPHWLHATIKEELCAIEIIGSTHDIEHEEHTLIVYSTENDKEVKRARVVVAFDVNTRMG
ncbi:unnamed protein product [Rhizoctonia solani]|uniref:Transmembrane protein n=1 Tax=Rhizoctonia solani TaxID=456999 RepID=A0A8H2X019_9AGAM|nr:unnamed protein product [Rhizoctonia solani]